MCGRCFVFILAIVLIACGSPGNQVVFEDGGEVAMPELELGLSADQRFQGLEPPRLDEAPVTWTAPAHWIFGAPQQMRLATYHPHADPRMLMTVTRLPSRDIGDNFNRWNGLFGLPPLSSEAIAQLPTIEILGRSEPILEINGDYQDTRTGISGDDYALLGTMAPLPDGETAIFLKLVGPAEAVGDERDAFVDFARSLELRRR